MEKIERWGLIDRISHWLLVISFILGFVTGLPVFDNELFGWLLPLSGGRDIRLFIHHWVLMILLGIVVILQLIKFAQKKGTEAFPTMKDVKDLIKLIKRWFGAKVEEPKLGFHHPAEKFVFLSAFVSIIIFAITGPILVFELGGPSILLWARFFHTLAVMLMLIVLAGHFITAISPQNWKVLKAMFLDGYVDIEWAKRHSPLWAEQAQKS